MPPLTADAERVVAWLRSVRFCDGLDSEQLAAIAGEISHATVRGGRDAGVGR